jgi:type I restriction enzyme, R subunit
LPRGHQLSARHAFGPDLSLCHDLLGLGQHLSGDQGRGGHHPAVSDGRSALPCRRGHALHLAVADQKDPAHPAPVVRQRHCRRPAAARWQWSCLVGLGNHVFQHHHADHLRRAALHRAGRLAGARGRGSTVENTNAAVEVLIEKCEVAHAILHGYDWKAWATAGGAQRLALIPGAQEHILQQQDGKKRFISIVSEIARAFALCGTRPQAIDLRDEIGFYQAVQSALRKTEIGERSGTDLDYAIQQLVSSAIMAPGEVIDVFMAAGLKRPDISILSEDFLKEVMGMKHKNLAAEILAKLLAGEIKTGSSRNVVQSRLFSEMLKKTLAAYHNRAIATQEIIEELIKLARAIEESKHRGDKMKLSEDELAFYDALAANESAVLKMGNAELQVIAAELVTKVRTNVTIDWTLRESARAKIKVMVKRILRKYGYPPDLQDEAVQTVLFQAESLCKDWAA